MSHTSLRSWRGPILAAVALLALGTVLWGCGKKTSLVTAPTVATEEISPGNALALRLGDVRVQAAMRVQNAHTPDLLRVAGVVGTAITADASGKPAIMVMTESAMAPGRLPAVLDGFPVVEEVTGKIVAFKGSGGGVSHTAKQTPPIQLGTSGGSVVDIANGYCCSGTLGALVQKGGIQYILSNSHVLAGDVVPGGNGVVSQIGDDIMQPGYVDNNCTTTGANIVADLSSLSTLYPPASTPNVDCAIAQVRAGMVRTDGAILEIGTISAQTVAAFVNQAVKKSGRTTALTRSTVTGLNATVNVGYETECAGTTFTKTFTGQIMIKNRRSTFLNSGDSGSLMVEDVTTNPRAVGLLYAGSSTTAVANPIGAVLNHLGATMVGQCTAFDPSAVVSPNLRRNAGARSRTGRLACAAACIVIACAVAACRPHAPGGKTPRMPERPIADVLAAHTPALMALPGVVGTYQGAQPDGWPVIVVMVAKRSAELERRIPKSLEGWPVRVEVTGEIRAMPDSGR